MFELNSQFNFTHLPMLLKQHLDWQEWCMADPSNIISNLHLNFIFSAFTEQAAGLEYGQEQFDKFDKKSVLE